MKRTFALLGGALLALTLLVGCNQSSTGVTIGVVDEAAAFKDNKAAAKAMKYLQDLGAPLQKKAEEAYKAMQQEQNEANVAAYKKAMGELQMVMNGEQQRVVALIDAKFNQVLETYRKEKGLTLILSKQGVIAADKTVDITADIVAAMDKADIDLTPPQAPAAPAAEAAPAAPAPEQAAAPAAPAPEQEAAPAAPAETKKAE
ncbi:OmpH family outer membrane protein [Pseudodesulfovibrio sp.]|uniref:OmpH family outer membrane protein n=1 Tax=Pseudodesulfovibrio sp. TaxID=2035812 RepID=UPI00262E41C2|nr:OmpH family outer membrane protein [Pseudodesulfovibrio sp.]MDD3311290.1 OmpH family outer membrane protein [Pseudodesulfovibrio sp.]